MTHYTRPRGKRFRMYPFLLCQGCFDKLPENRQSLYKLCLLDCGTIGGCERCQRETDEDED